MTITTASPTASIQQALADVADAIDEIKSLTPTELASAHTRMKIYSALQGAEGQSVYTPDLQKELDKLHDKYDRLQRADAEKQNELNHVHRRLTEIVEKRKSKTVSMQIVPDNINAEDIQSEDPPKDFTERTFSDWLSQMKQG